MAVVSENIWLMAAAKLWTFYVSPAFTIGY